LEEYRLNISVFDDFTEISFTGLEPTRIEYGFDEFKTLTQIHYGTEWSEETGRLAEKIESKYLKGGALKHHAGALALLIKGYGQYILEEYFPKNVIQKLRALPKDSTIRLVLNEEASVVPWELLHTGRNFICLDHILGRINSEFGTREPVRRQVVPMLLISDPTGDLWGAQNEANYILGQLRGSNIQIHRYGSEIRKKQYMDLLGSGRYDIIHYSGHSASSNEPGKSHHMFMDGPLFGNEIESLEGRMPLFVFSNSCQSAENILSVEETGNTSLAGSYQKAGVSGCIAALWAVSDVASGMFSSDFYRYILYGNTVGSALLHSRRNAFRRWGFQDYIWVNYIYFGDPDLRLL